MHLDARGANELARGVMDATADAGPVQVAVCPPYVHLGALSSTLKNSRVRLGAQNMHSADKGPFTGEISASMLLSVGCHYVILGHSERRQKFGETDASVNAKVKRALRTGLVPIICVGEHLRERSAGAEKEVVASQIKFALEDLKLVAPNALVIAYEPVWAIGTGKTATPGQAQEIHALIRSLLVRQFGGEVASGVHILYGGSMNPGNARELLVQPDVDGGLIGGASLKAEDFGAIVEIAQSVSR